MTKKTATPTVHCLVQNLSKAISAVSRHVATRATLPVLSTILLATDGARLKLSATNLETALTAWIGANISPSPFPHPEPIPEPAPSGRKPIEGVEGWAIAIPAKTFADVVNSIGDEELTLTLDSRTQTLTIVGGAYVNAVKGINAAEFPIIQRVGEGREPSLRQVGVSLSRLVEGLPAILLEHAIRLTAFAAATDDARPALASVNFVMDRYGLTLAATDGFRLSRAVVPFPGLPDLKAMVPAGALTDLASLLKQDDEVTVQIADNQIRFKFGAYEMVAQLVEGTFPNYENIIPKKSTTSAVVTGDSLIRACKAADIFARENSHAARFLIAPSSPEPASPELAEGELAEGEPVEGGGLLTVSAQSAETGSNEITVDAAVQGEGLEIAFNVRFVLDALNAMKAKSASLELTNATSPAVLRDTSDANFLHVLMPMRLK